MKKMIFLMALALALTGCVTKYPYVANISSDGKGNLILQKNNIVLHDSLFPILGGPAVSIEPGTNEIISISVLTGK